MNRSFAAGVAASGQQLDAGLLVMASTVSARTDVCPVVDVLRMGKRRDGGGLFWLTTRPRRAASHGMLYSFGHFPIIAGVIGFAVAIEESVAHAGDPLGGGGVAALVLGIVLFVGGGGIALALSGNGFPLPRAVAIALVGVATVVFLQVPAWTSMAVVAAIVAVLVILERPPTPVDV